MFEKLGPRACVVTLPLYAHNEKMGLDNFLRLLMPCCSEIFVITGNFPHRYEQKIRVVEVESGKSYVKRGLLARILRNLAAQIKVALYLFRLSGHFSVVLFHAGVYHNRLPVLLAKLLRKKVIVYQFGGNYSLESRLTAMCWGEKLVYPIAAFISRLNYRLADVIICEGGSNLARWNGLERYRRKLVHFVARYVDTERLRIKKPLSERPKVVGYFGRLDPKKGIVNLVRAMPLIAKSEEVRFIIAGDGPLRDSVEQEVERAGVRGRVTFIPWVEEGALADFMNSLKLLVLPTYDDGIPEVIKEAMACGTPVAVTPVGGIPDVITDGQEGFIIHDNTPEGIAKTVIKALTYPGLDLVAGKARALIEREYRFEVMAKRYKDMLARVASKPRKSEKGDEHIMIKCLLFLTSWFTSPSWALAYLKARGRWSESDAHQRRVGRLVNFLRSTEEAISWLVDVDFGLQALHWTEMERSLKELATKVTQNRQTSAPIPPEWDASPTLGRLCYIVVRVLEPSCVVETGVGAGVNSAHILQALHDNKVGMLYSVELPSLIWGYKKSVGKAVPSDLKARWRIYLGPSESLLPKIAKAVQHVDIFIHDSAHTYRDMLIEYKIIWPYLRSGGILISGDVHKNDAFIEFAEEVHRTPLVVPRERGGKTLIGLLRK